MQNTTISNVFDFSKKYKNNFSNKVLSVYRLKFSFFLLFNRFLKYILICTNIGLFFPSFQFYLGLFVVELLHAIKVSLPWTRCIIEMALQKITGHNLINDLTTNDSLTVTLSVHFFQSNLQVICYLNKRFYFVYNQPCQKDLLLLETICV